MNDWDTKVLLEQIIYKMFRGVDLEKFERKMAENIVEVRDYGLELD